MGRLFGRSIQVSPYPSQVGVVIRTVPYPVPDAVIRTSITFLSVGRFSSSASDVG